MLDLTLIREAAAFLDGRVRRTPLVASPELSDRVGRPVLLKLENFQLTGSFKVRGALFALYKLGEHASAGVATCSAGNHGLGVAHAARELGIEAVIYVPSSIDGAKRDGLSRLGARVLISDRPGFDETEEWAVQQAAAQGLPYISAYDDPDVMAGNGGSLALEILDECPEARTLVVPVGGGGMAGGIAATFAGLARPLKLVAAQLDASAALVRSLEEGRAVTRMPPADTVAGGLEGGLGRLPFEMLRDAVYRIERVDEAGVWSGVRWMLETHGMLIEPSSAVAIQACLALGDETGPEPIVVVVSGRNVSASTVHRILGGHQTA